MIVEPQKSEDKMATRESPGKANELQNLLFMPA